MHLSKKLLELMKPLEIIDYLDPNWAFWKYKNYGIGQGDTWIKHYISHSDYLPRMEEIAEILKKTNISFYSGKEQEVKIVYPLASDRIVFRIHAIPLTKENGLFTLDKSNDFIQVANGRAPSVYKQGAVFDMTLLEGYSETTINSSYSELLEAEYDCYVRMLKFIDDLEDNTQNG